MHRNPMRSRAMQDAANIGSHSVAQERRTHWPITGFVTANQILGRNGGPIPVSASRWWAGVRAGEFPKPVKLGGRTVWRVSDIDAFIAQTSEASRSLK